MGICTSRERDRGDFCVKAFTIEALPEQLGGPRRHEGVQLLKDGFDVPSSSPLFGSEGWNVTIWMNPDPNVRTPQEIAAVKGHSHSIDWWCTYVSVRLKLVEVQLTEDAGHPEWVSIIKVEYVQAEDPKQMTSPIASMRNWGEGAVLETLGKQTFEIAQSEEDQIACRKLVDHWRTMVCQDEGTYPGTKKYQLGSFAS